MRLTADMIARSPAFFNACREREIDLRGNKIAAIDNQAATQNQFDSIDLSDNEIRKLESMARLPRVTMLLLSNNRISRVDENVGQAFPKLEHLVLTNNHFATLKELEALAALQSLKTLSLVDNKVTKVENYRAFVISLLPNLKILDFQKIKPREREEVEAAYGSAAKRPRLGSAAPAGSAGASSSTFVPGQPDGAEAAAAPAAAAPKAAPTAEQLAAIKAAIDGASSVEEVAKLEKALKSGNYDVAAALAADAGST